MNCHTFDRRHTPSFHIRLWTRFQEKNLLRGLFDIDKLYHVDLSNPISLDHAVCLVIQFKSVDLGEGYSSVAARDPPVQA